MIVIKMVQITQRIKINLACHGLAHEKTPVGLVTIH